MSTGGEPAGPDPRARSGRPGLLALDLLVVALLVVALLSHTLGSPALAGIVYQLETARLLIDQPERADAFQTPARTPSALPLVELTDREREVLNLLAAGASNDAIARKLFVSSKTVRNTVSGIYAKLHANGRAEAIVKAREAGFGQS